MAPLPYTRARRGSSFSQLGLEPNHTGWTAQSTLLLRRVVQSKTQWHSNVLKLLQKSSQAWKTFFQLLQIKRLELKLTNTLQNSFQIQSQHQVPRTLSNNIQKHHKAQKQTKIHLQALPCTNWFHLVPNWFLPRGSYGSLVHRSVLQT